VATQGSGVIGGNGTQLGNRFNPNPHVGDAIVATFFWLGSAHVTSVSDHLSGGQQVGNTYTLVDSISSGGVGMATYIATNAQNFPDTSTDPTGARLLVVQADLSASVTDGGVMLSAYSGVQPTYAQAVAAHHARSGAASSTTIADPDSIAVVPGGLAYGVTVANASVTVDRPTAFNQVAHVSDPSMIADGVYTVPTSAQTVDPRWTWHFTTQSTWLASDLALNPSAGATGPGNLTATTSTSTTTTDPDGYTVAVDNGPAQAIGTNASYTFANLASGGHTVVLSGVASNCTVAGGTTHTVTVPPGGTATAAFSVGCSAPSGTGISFDQWNGTYGVGRMLIKGFNPQSPHVGDAIVATIVWRSSINNIDSVTDVLTTNPYSSVGNTYHLVSYVTSGGLSMATYVATNAQHFPDAYNNPTRQDSILAVRANFADSVQGAILISAYRGVELTYAGALGEFHSAAGTGTGNTIADPGAISVNAGALAYGVTLGPWVGLAGPQSQGFTSLVQMSDSAFNMKNEGDYSIRASAGSVDPQWTWSFSTQSTWLASVLALNPAASGSTNQPPVAAFGSTCSALTCNFTSTSSDPDGSIASYSWTFGDGGTSTVQNPSHSYAAAGTYTVVLTVTDNLGATNSVSHSVTVSAANQPPVAAFSSSCSALTCAFTSTSSDPDGSIASYRWTFGDGSAAVTTQNASHTYAAGGTYTVTLQVTDNQGATNSTSQSVTVAPANQPPVASFTRSCNGLSCSFTSTSSDPDGSIASYRWTFGDGSAAVTTQNASHTYAAGGTYTVTLQVTDNQGATNATSQNITVTPPNQPPVASFTQSCNGLSCSFTSTSSDPDGSIASYRWTFGDGSAAVTTQNASHTYAAGGTYTVTLQVTDNQGATNSTSKNITVSQPNSAPVVNAGPDETAVTGLLYSTSVSFTDANNNGPWSYTINWGDGSTSTGTRTAQGSFTVSHTYVILLPRSFTVTLTVTDAAGASGSDSKVVSVLLL